MTLLDIDGLDVDIRTPAGVLHAVRSVEMSVEAGETLCVVGESGCGKSLTAMAILGLLPASASRRARRLVFDGQDLQTMSEPQMRDLRGDDIGMIFQDPMTALNPSYTIGDQLTEVFLCHRKGSRREANDRAVSLLERVGISAARSRLAQYPHQLSGGLRQRVVIAMALMCEPKLLIADEPTTALDVTIQAQILHLIKDLQKEISAGVILITHDLGIVAQVADQVAVMYAGEVVETAPVAAVFETPGHPYTLGLMGCIPVRGKVRRGGRLGVIPGIVPSLIGEIPGCSFRTRCPVSEEACVSEIPVRCGAGSHRWRCIHQRIPSAASTVDREP
ncbi:MAG: ABC transporter ATP-binding protein [Paracoccaceae bacterium]|nr:ABC transporter ATP-binding protein [Paracoccaceae bacterium]